jgi:imidazolonepropionase
MNKLIVNIRQMVTPSGSSPLLGSRMGELDVREGVGILLRDERIAEIVERPWSAPAGIEIVDAGGGIVVPGLVDPCVEMAGRSWPWKGTQTVDNEAEEASTRREALGPRVRRSLRELLRHGTTTLEVRAFYGPVLSAEDALEIVREAAAEWSWRLSTCVCASPGFGPRGGKEDRISAVIGETIPVLRRRQLAASCCVLCGEGGYERKEAQAILRAARGAGMNLRISSIGSTVDAVRLAAEMEVENVDRLADPRRSELDQLRRADVSAVVLPSLSVEGSRPWPNARGMIDADLAVSLGTGSDLLGAGTLSMLTQVSLAANRMQLTLEEALTAATLNAAAAVGLAHEVGSIEPGKRANLLILDLQDYRELRGFLVGAPIRAVVLDGRVTEGT